MLYMVGKGILSPLRKCYWFELDPPDIDTIYKMSYCPWFFGIPLKGCLCSFKANNSTYLVLQCHLKHY